MDATVNLFALSFFLFSQGECEGYTVKTKEEDFTISNYPLEQTEFLYGQKQGKVSSTQNNLRLFTDRSELD